jgi:peptide/nickel transport system substrate-binding protein
VHRAARAAALCALVALCGCVKAGTVSQTGSTGTQTSTTERQRPAHVLVYADGQNFDTLNPHLYQATSLSNLSSLTMGWLTRYDSENKPFPELLSVLPTIENGGVSKDGRTITWHLRRGVKWSDGAPFDADDVVFSTQAVINPKNNEVGRDGWDLITKIDEPDKYTVVYHMKKPYAPYLASFFGTAGANPCIIPKHILGDLPNINTAPYNALPVGIGPFRYVAWKRGDSVVMEANPYYWRGTPKLKQIVYKQIPDRNTLLTQLQTGEIDLWSDVGAGYVPRAAGLAGHTTITPIGSYFGHLDFNVTHPPLDDVRVRRALRFALDRETILKEAFHNGGVAQESMISPVFPQYRKFDLVPTDVTQANALLDQAGWTDRDKDGIRMKNGKRFSLEYAIYSGAADVDTMVELIRSMWKAIGVAIEVKHYDTGLFFALMQNGGISYGGKFDVESFYWGGDPIGDNTNLYSCGFIPPNGQNVTRWCDKRFDDDMAHFKALLDPKARQPYLDDAVARVIDQVPTIVLYIRNDNYSFASGLTGFHPGALAPFDDFMNVDIQ